MNPEALLSELRARGVRLEADGERLRWRAPTGVMTVTLLRAVQAHKPVLLMLVREGARRDAQRLRAAEVIFDGEPMRRGRDGAWHAPARCYACGTVRAPNISVCPVCHPPAASRRTQATPEVA